MSDAQWERFWTAVSDEKAAIEQIKGKDNALDRLHAFVARLTNYSYTDAGVRALALETAAIVVEQEARIAELERPINELRRGP